MRIVLIVLVFALTLYALLDCARTPDESMPARMPKYLWITLVVLFPTIGPIAWIIFSRVKAAEERGGYVEPTVWSSKEGTTFLLAEQNTNVALRYAHYGYILESGRVVMDGEAAALRENPDVKEFYLGMAEEGRKSFRDVRSYRRRKRWLA